MSKSALRISLLYLLLGVLWVILSDRFTYSLSESLPGNLAQSLKGMFFVACTSIFLYFLIRKNSRNLLSSENHYRQLFEENPTPMWIYEVSSRRILAVNEAALKKYGYSQEEFLMLQPDELKAAESSAEETVARRKNKRIQPVRHLKKNGESFYVQISANPIKFLDRKARLVTAADVNERMIAEEKNKDISRQLSDFRYAISSAVLVSAIDASGKISWVNENFCRLSQYSSNELIGQNFQFLSSGHHPESFFSDIWQLLKKGCNWRGEIINRAKDGSFFWLDVSMVPIRDINERLTHFFIICTDISDKKQVEERLVQREKLLSSLVNSQTSFLIRLKQSGKYAYANARYLQKFELSEKSLSGKSFHELLPLAEAERFEEVKEKCLQNPGEIIPLEIYTELPEGNASWTSWEFTGVESESGGPMEIQGMGLEITKRKVAEQELQKFERRFERILESINEAFFTIDQNWNFIKVNRRFKEVIRKEPEEILGQSLWSLFPDVPGTLLAQKLKETMENGVPVTFEEEDPDRGVWFQISIYPVPEGVSGYLRDISQKKEAERRIKQAVERYDTLAKATFDTIWEWDLKNDTLNWNDGIKTNFKYSKVAIPDSIKRWGEKVHPDDYKRVIDGIQETIHKKRTQWEAEYRMLCGDGSYRYIIDRGHVIYDELNQPVRMIGAIQDIHQQREYQQEIQKLSLVAEKTQNAVIITNQYGLIEWVNEGFTRLTGWEAEEVINRKPGNFLQGPATDADTLEKIRHNLQKKQRFSAELINYTKSGNPYWVRIDVSPILDDRRKVVKYIAIESDITERMRFEERLKKKNEMLQEIAWISSHDIRRPVASIMGLISLYDLENPAKPFNKEIINLLDFSAKELDKVIRKIVYKTYEVDEMKEKETEKEKA